VIDQPILFAITTFGCALLFGLGLGVSQMSNPQVVANFFRYDQWDPSLLFVFGGCMPITMITFRSILSRDRPIFVSSFALPSENDITAPLTVGAACFGVGWGMNGVCPGPAIFDLVHLGWTLIWMGSFAAMAYLNALLNHLVVSEAEVSKDK